MTNIAQFDRSTVRVFVFDVDDTLTRNTIDIKINIFKELFPDALDRLQEGRELYEFTGKGDRFNIIAHVIDVLQAEAHTDEQVAFYAKEFEQRTKTAIREQGLYPDDITTLTKLRRIYPCYLLSATPTEAVAGNIAHFEAMYPEIQGMFADVIGTPMKDGKGGEILSIAAKHELLPQNILMVGDGDGDRKAADISGSQFVGIVPDSAADKWPGETFPKINAVSKLTGLLKLEEK